MWQYISLEVPDGQVAMTGISGTRNVLSRLEVIGLNPGRVKLGMHATSVHVALEPKILLECLISILILFIRLLMSNNSDNFYL